MPQELVTAEKLKSLYGLRDSVEQIGKAYPLVFAITREEQVHHYVVDTLGVLYTFCDKCRESKVNPRKPIGTLEQISPSSGKMVKRGCGHPCYVPALKEVKSLFSTTYDAHMKAFVANRTGRTKTGSARRRWIIPAVAATATLVLLGIWALVAHTSAAPKAVPVPKGVPHLEELLSKAESAGTSGADAYRMRVQDARKAYDGILKEHPGWVMGLLSQRVRLERLEKKVR